MLILGRRVGESIVIDGGITVVVLACDKGGVRLGVRAPDHVTILRGEIVEQVAEENRRAAAPAGGAARALAAALRGDAAAARAAPAQAPAPADAPAPDAAPAAPAAPAPDDPDPAAGRSASGGSA